MSTSQANTTWPPAELSARLEALQARVLARPAEAYAELQTLLSAVRAEERSRATFIENDLLGEGTVLDLLSSCALLLGDEGGAAQYAEAGYRLAREQGLPSLEACCLEVRGLVCGRQGDVEQAARLMRRSLQLLLDTGDDAGRGRLLRRVGGGLEWLEAYPQALTLYRESLNLLPPGSPGAAAVEAGLARVLFRLGHTEESRQVAAQALAYCQAQHLTHVEGQVQLQQALNCLTLGQLAASHEHAGQAQALAQATDDGALQGAAAWVQGETALARGDLVGAAQALECGEKWARHLGRSDLLAQVRESQSRLHEQRGEAAQALSCLREQRRLEQAHRAQRAEQRGRLLNEHIQFEVLRCTAVQGREPVRPGRAAPAPHEAQVPQPEAGRLASFDQLTGLADHTFFWGRTRQALQHLVPGRSLGLVVADIDHFRAINDRFGQAAGDRLLAELARRLPEAVRPGDLVGRLSGDRFAVLLSDLAHPGDLALVAERLLQSLRESCEFGAELLVPTVSLGCAVAPQDGGSAEVLQQHAELALFQAKMRGRNMAVVFTGDMSTAEQERRQLTQDLRRAVRQGQLQLHYQAQFELSGQRLSGFEALVRWPHPERGMIPPDRFIALAEESRLILELGRWVLNEASRQARAWALSERGLTMAVNVSALQFEQPDFVAGVRACLEQHGLPPHTLVLELTESMVHRDPRLARQTLLELQALGVQVAMDDFGTGYSSLSMLKSLPFGLLKIDREFLRDLCADCEQFAASQQFIEVMVRLAHNLNMRVVAEGVETAEQYALLCGMGCDEAQGYWLARPLPPEEAAALLPGDGDPGPERQVG